MTPEEAYSICLKNNKRDKNLEQYIIKDPGWSYYYARDIIKGRWKEAEQYIINDSRYAYYYSRNIIEGKLPEHMHNAMVLHGLNNDDYAKLYFNFIKNKP
jgi:hypothetical protein